MKINKQLISKNMASTSRRLQKLFFDPSLVIVWDKKHSEMDEMRYAAFGLSKNMSLLVTIHVDRQEKIRIISSRKAEKKEVSIYARQ